MNLDYDLALFRQSLNQAAAAVVELYGGLEQRKVVQAVDVAEVRGRFAEPLPENPETPDVLIQRIQTEVFDNTTLSLQPGFFAYVQSGATQMGVVAELLSAALNQNCGKWHLSPAGVELERLVIRWIAEFIGYGPESNGILTSGGSTANLLCLAAALRTGAPWDVKREGLAGRPPLVFYSSREGHFCLDKSMIVLGLGENGLRKIPVTENFTIDIDALEAQIEHDIRQGAIPVGVIGHAGTINTGAVDPLNRLADLCQRYRLWLHVDAAYGGPAASLAEKRKLFEGFHRADSIAVDPHKWLYMPIEAGCALIRDDAVLRDTYGLLPDYLKTDRNHGGREKVDRYDLFEHSFQLTRNFKALKIWTTFKAYGAGQLRRAIADNIKAVAHLAAMVEDARDFQSMAPAPLSILVFRYTGADGKFRGDAEALNALNQRLLDEIEADGRVFLTGTLIEGCQVLRVCCVNHRTGFAHMERLLAVLREIGERVSIEMEVCS